MSKMRKKLLEIGKRRVGYRVKTCEVKAFWNNTWGVTNPNYPQGALLQAEHQMKLQA